ncbi:hypothetical protein GF386_04510 [Candidatus Pacearchaeota archaeon]|nr:hypothetical protein [Candidatus Pacearchaeota archaeon]MBD3283387.1 hypothetical protein [Candidatus Pacearchaeota archaeon]
MQVIDFGESIKVEDFSGVDFVREMHRIAERYLADVHEARRLTIDMDGVLIFDDNAITTARIVAGDEAQRMFSEYAGLNIRAVAQGETSYCWYAPTLFVGDLLRGLQPEINSIIGENMRLIPGAGRTIGCLRELGYDIAAVTAGHLEAARSVSERVGIERTISTELGVSNGLYDGSVRRFIGGKHKLEVVRELLGYNGTHYNGTHIGDSWSDVETLKAVPNSVAFNPGCEFALRNARISVLGTSLLGLLPFFDESGAYDSEVGEEDLPRKILIMDNRTQDLAQLLAESRGTKKEIGRILDRTIKYDYVESGIRRVLGERGVKYRTSVDSFMSPEEFDVYAKKAYRELGR